MFPELFDLAFFVPFFFRVVLGYYLFRQALFLMKQGGGVLSKDRTAQSILGLLILADGILLFVGAWLQPTAIITSALGIFALISVRKHPKFFPQPGSFYLLATLIALSLVVLGPGIWAYDLPL
jgi:hypothetical protein